MPEENALNVNLRDLEPTFTISDDSLFLIQVSGFDRKADYGTIIGKVNDSLKSDLFNSDWNASKLNGIPTNARGSVSLDEDVDILNGQVFMYQSIEGGYAPTQLDPTHIDWSSLSDSGKYLQVDAQGNMIAAHVVVQNLKPSSSGQGGKFLRVSDDGMSIIESTFDLSQTVAYASAGVDNLNLLGTGHYSTKLATINKPINEEGYTISSRADAFTQSATQIYASIETDRLYFRRNDGSANDSNDFKPWQEIYHTANHPISNSITADSSVSIASSRSVKTVNDKIVALQELYTPADVLTKIKTVDGTGSGLDADTLDGKHLSDLNNDFVNTSGDVMTGPLQMNGNAIRFDATDNSSSILSNSSRMEVNSQKPVRIQNGTASQALYTGGLLASDTYADATKIPVNGVYSKGKVDTASGVSVNASEVIDANGKMDWASLKNIPPLVPTGTIITFPTSNVPNGYIKCNGAAISRTVYATLFQIIGTMYGAGDGSTTFNLPDYRGEFHRGWDDGRGVDSSRTIGSSQSDAFRNHGHSASSAVAGSHDHSASSGLSGQHSHDTSFHAGVGSSPWEINSGGNWGNHYGYVSRGTGKAVQATDNSYSVGSPKTSVASNHNHSINVDDSGDHAHAITVNATGGNETRPRNVSVMYCIKY